MEALERCGGCPRLVRKDMGTENVVIRDIQRYLRRDDEDDRAVREATSQGQAPRTRELRAGGE